MKSSPEEVQTSAKEGLLTQRVLGGPRDSVVEQRAILPGVHGKQLLLLIVKAYLIRKASNTRITLVRRRCAWYLTAKLKPHRELLFD